MSLIKVQLDDAVVTVHEHVFGGEKVYEVATHHASTLEHGNPACEYLDLSGGKTCHIGRTFMCHTLSDAIEEMASQVESVVGS